MSRIDAAIAAKIDKRTELEKAGVNPHPYYFAKSHTIAQCRDSLETKVKTAGRVISFRPHGKVIFVDLSDQSGRIQVMFRQSEIGEQVFDQIKKLLDPGDFLGVEGLVTTTKTGEVTIIADKYEFLGKAIRPLPSSWNAAEDKEIRFRKRYLDMLVNPEVKKILDARWLIEKEIRRFLQDKFDFTEVETPILQPLYGGTNAKPFTTHMNALDSDLYLRIAPELYLKRLIVGGYDRIFEIARNFRNEGMDQTHNPEFTMIEWYQTYADYHQMMDTAESLIRHLVQVVKGNTILQIHNTEVDVKDPWPRLKMTDAVNEHLKLDFESTSDDELKKLIAQNNLEMPVNFTRGLALFVLFDKLVAPRLINPTWIIDYPRDVSPLAKQHRVLAGFAERFEAYIGGKELADGWSEIVDPIDQRSIFENEQKRMRSGDSEAHPMDEEFLEAMEYGMPPLGGIGMGIDRLVMFLTNTWSIREVVAFPTQKQLPSQMASHQATTQIESKKEAAAPQETTQITTLPSREAAQQLLEEHIKNKALRWHCEMVAMAMEAYAQELGEDSELWYQAGLLHDLDWESHPDEHPNHAVKNILSAYPEVLKHAILAHAPDRTGVQPSSTLERYLFACDEISGFFNAVALLRPEGFAGMKVSSITKKLKDKSFAVNVSRDDIAQGCELINKDIAQHIQFLIGVFGNLPKQN